MLPAHHKPRPQSKTSGVYLCAVISLSLCLLVTFRYWKTEVSELLLLNQQLRDELSKKNIELLQAGESISKTQTRISELEIDLSKREASISDLTGSVEKEAAKCSDLQKKLDASEEESEKCQKLNTEADSKLVLCQSDLSDKQKKERECNDLLEDENAKLSVLAAQLQTEKERNAKLAESLTAAEATKGTANAEGQSSKSATSQVGTEERIVQPEHTVPAKVAGQDELSKGQAFGGDGVAVTDKTEATVDPTGMNAPDDQEAMRKEGQEGKVMFIQGGMEATTGIKQETDPMRNPRSGNQGAGQDVHADPLMLDAQQA